ncbi:MAG: hypothetical protein KC502_19720 [Myxococcales bacterium]|nr:hypothetical protein [Myxococcales bacterium]
MLRYLVVFTLITVFATPALADPPIDSWDRGSTAPPSPGAVPPPPSGADDAPAVDVKRKRPVIHRRRGRIDMSSLKARDFGQKILIGVFTGGRIYSANAQIGNSPNNSLQAASGPILGLRTGYGITRFFAIQGEAVYQPTTYTDGGDFAHILSFRGFMMLHLMWKAWRPFLLVGGGVEMLPHKIGTVAKDVDGAFMAGLGTKFDLSHTTSLRFDFRGISTDGIVDGAINYEVHLGLSFRFMVQ